MMFHTNFFVYFSTFVFTLICYNSGFSYILLLNSCTKPKIVTYICFIYFLIKSVPTLIKNVYDGCVAQDVLQLTVVQTSISVLCAGLVLNWIWIGHFCHWDKTTALARFVDSCNSQGDIYMYKYKPHTLPSVTVSASCGKYACQLQHHHLAKC